MRDAIQEQPFVGFIADNKNHIYQVYLVNPTDTAYRRVAAFTGSFCGDEDGLLETSKLVKELGPLAPNSEKLLEEDDWDGLDFLIWYHLDLYPESDSLSPQRVWFSLPKYLFGYTVAPWPEVLPKNWTGA